MKNNKAQSTLEYIILTAAVVAVIFAFLGGGGFRNRVNNIIGDAIQDVDQVGHGIDYSSEGVEYNIPEYPSAANTPTPPEGWDYPGMPCSGSATGYWDIDFLGLDENGLPIFSDPDEYVGNQCAEDDPDRFNYPTIDGQLVFDQNGTLMIGRGTQWFVFDWNNPAHAFWALQRQRYGDYWVSGCGYGGHSSDFFAAWENVFGEAGGCQDVMDHYYGNDLLEGLTGDLAIYNGLTLTQASYKSTMIKHSLNPDSPGYNGTPANPAPWVSGWGVQDWLRFYNDAIRFGLGGMLQFTIQDICAAFPGEPCP